jgi:hypothetical protein
MSPNAGGRGGVAGSQPMSTAVLKKLWRSNSIFNLWSSFNILGKNNIVQYFVERNEKVKKETKLIRNKRIIEK